MFDMKNLRFPLLFTCLLAIAQVTFAQGNKGFAVVELFTSEGCSSCPPADRLVASVMKEYTGQNVYVLAYHVDYWNRLGWKDAFSSAAWSARQNEYVIQMGLSGAYTPQVVVNGKTEFTGSDSRKLHAAINKGLETTAEGNISLHTTVQKQTVEINYTVAANTNSAKLHVALVQKMASSNVKAGENSGNVLKHVNVVRALKTVVLNGQKIGNLQMDIPGGLSIQDCSVIVFLQGNDGTIKATNGIDRL